MSIEDFERIIRSTISVEAKKLGMEHVYIDDDKWKRLLSKTVYKQVEKCITFCPSLPASEVHDIHGIEKIFLKVDARLYLRDVNVHTKWGVLDFVWE